MDSGSGFVSVERQMQGEHEWTAPSIAAPDDVAAATRWDRAAIERVVREVAPRVFDTVRAICGPASADTDDIVQESLVALVRALPQFEGRSSLAHYASRIAARTAIAARKRARSFGRHDEELVTRLADTTTKQPYRQLVLDRRRAMVRMLLDELPVVQSEALALRFCVGLSMEEIAETTQTPLNTVYSRLRLAKAALRSRIEHDPVLADLQPETER